MVDITRVFAGIAVTDFEAGRRWYERLFGRPPDRIPKQEEAVWHIPGAGSVYVVADAQRAGSGLLALDVSELRQHVAALGQRGFATEADDLAPDPLFKFALTDPDGNSVTFFQEVRRAG